MLLTIKYETQNDIISKKCVQIRQILKNKNKVQICEKYL